MQRRFRSVSRFFWLATLFLLAIIPLFGVASALWNWHGVCLDRHGAEFACSWGRFAVQEMFWAVFLLIPFLFLAALVHLGMAFIEFIVSLTRRGM